MLKTNNALSKLLFGCNNIVFFGGAGVSTESGIPDFRSANGLYRNSRQYSPETILSHDFFYSNTDAFYEFYKEKMLFSNALPNRAHTALAAMECDGRLKAVITQNIDGLHQKAGSKNVLELHGSVHRNYCTKCGKFYNLGFIIACAGIPRCACGGIIKPDVVLYGEALCEEVLQKAIAYISDATALIVGGTSLAVHPAAGLVDYYKGNKLILINKSPTPMDARADLVISGSLGAELCTDDAVILQP